MSRRLNAFRYGRCSTPASSAAGETMFAPLRIKERVMKKFNSKKIQSLKLRQQAPMKTPTDLDPSATKDIAGALNAIAADVFALYLKTKNFHWHMSGPHFRDYH